MPLPDSSLYPCVFPNTQLDIIMIQKAIIAIICAVALTGCGRIYDTSSAFRNASNAFYQACNGHVIEQNFVIKDDTVTLTATCSQIIGK
jgi:uncharacterized lipoprotein YehR (DUF1307 family)